MLENFKISDNLKISDPRFGCGPSLIPTEFVQKLAATGPELLGTSHRKPGIKNTIKEIQEGLKKYFSLPDGYEVLLGNGGATFLFDSIGLGIVEKKITHFTCGEFSKKWYKSSDMIPWIEAGEIAVEFGKGISPSKVVGSDVIACTLNETSTGVVIDAIPEVDDNTILAIDATSGGGQVPCDVSKVDLFFFSPQKVFASEGGLFVAIASPKFLERAEKIAADKTRYVPGIMNWKTCIDNSLKNQTYTTPAVSTLFFLNEQIKKMNEAGYENVIKDGNKKAELLYTWALEHPKLSPFIEEKQYRSNVVATIDVDEKIPVGEILKFLEREKLAYGIDAYRKLGRNQFRISMFYNINYEDLRTLTKIIDLAIAEFN